MNSLSSAILPPLDLKTTFSQLFCASDHAGFQLKKQLVGWLNSINYPATDLGVFDEASVDYPDLTHLVCQKLQEDVKAAGLLICGSGIGMSMAANRFRHIRAALCHEPLSAHLSRAHNNANVLCLGGRLIGEEMGKECIMKFLQTAFLGGRHQRRIQKLG